MNKAYSRINWENYPSTDTPLNETNLNHMDLAVDTIDDRVITLDTTKADEADLLTCVASISFNSTTGIMTITLKNGTQGTIDTGLSKLAINFDYDDDPTSPHYQQIVMEMKDGTYKYIDLSALITQYEFTNSSTIAWTIGNDGTVSASVVDGSITAAKLQPNYLADIIVEVGKAQTAATNANADSLEAEGWAVGEQNGVPVSSGSPYYQNNAKYYSDHAGGQALSALTDVQLSSPTDGQALIYDANSGKWVNGEGGMHIIQIPVPTVTTYTYTGSIQTFQFDSVDTQHITISGDSQSQAGTYVVTATLKSANDVWSDLTNAPKAFSWTINKAQGSFSLDSHSVVVNSGTPTATVNVSSIVGDGAITATSADDSVATASYSTGVVTITAVGNGSTTITVTMAESANYLGASDTISAASSANITVTLTLNGAKEDNITIKDLNDVTVGTCIFATGQTSGTCQITIPANGGTYKFISSVAKSLDGQGNDYSKNYTLTNSLVQTVDVMPDSALLWYDNNVGSMAAVNIKQNSTHKELGTIIAASGTGYTSVLLNRIVNQGSYSNGYFNAQKINLANYSKAVIRTESEITISGQSLGLYSKMFLAYSTLDDPDGIYDATNWGTQAVVTNDSAPLFNGDKELSLAGVSVEAYIGITLANSNDGSSEARITKNNVRAIWLVE